ncbi:unnamed protein product [Brassica oleracea var. botrytis]
MRRSRVGHLFSTNSQVRKLCRGMPLPIQTIDAQVVKNICSCTIFSERGGGSLQFPST